MCFSTIVKNDQSVISSNLDLISSALKTEPDFDLVSMSEFLVTGSVSYPSTYYKGIKALEYGTLHTIDLASELPNYESCANFHDFIFNSRKVAKNVAPDSVVVGNPARFLRMGDGYTDPRNVV